jgi:hypothetical protein
MTIFVAETEGRAVAAMDAEDVKEARDFLLPAIEEMQREMWRQDMAYRLDESAAVTTRPATPAETVIWQMSKEKKEAGTSPVVWFFPVPRFRKR